jgi:lipopolysaccharide export system permease protein
MVLSRYILKEQAGPFAFSMIALTVILLLNQILKLLRYIVDKNLEPAVVGELFLLSLPFIIVLTIPMAVLLSCVLAYGRLTADSELAAMKASGLPLYRIMAPTVIAATLLAAALVLFQDRVLPETNHRIRNLTSDIARKRPTFAIEPEVVTELDKQTRLRVASVDHRTGSLSDVRILQLRNGAPPVNIMAPRGRMTLDSAGGLTLDLFDGEILDADPEDPLGLRRTRFTANSFYFQVDDAFERTDSDYRGDRELSIGDLQQRIRDNRVLLAEEQARIRSERRETEWPPTRAQAQRWQRKAKISANKSREINKYWVEIHKKLAISVACISFVLIGVPLGSLPNRGRNSLGVVLCIFLFILHYICLVGGERFADRGIVSPAVAMWAPDVVVSLIGLWLIRMNNYEVLLLRLDWLDRLLARRRFAEDAA